MRLQPGAVGHIDRVRGNVVDRGLAIVSGTVPGGGDILARGERAGAAGIGGGIGQHRDPRDSVCRTAFRTGSAASPAVRGERQTEALVRRAISRIDGSEFFGASAGRAAGGGMSSASWAAVDRDGCSAAGDASANLGGATGTGAGATEAGSAAAKRSANDSEGLDATVLGRVNAGGDSTITLLSATSGRRFAASGSRPSDCGSLDSRRCPASDRRSHRTRWCRRSRRCRRPSKRWRRC